MPGLTRPSCRRRAINDQRPGDGSRLRPAGFWVWGWGWARDMVRPLPRYAMMDTSLHQGARLFSQPRSGGLLSASLCSLPWLHIIADRVLQYLSSPHQASEKDFQLRARLEREVEELRAEVNDLKEVGISFSDPLACHVSLHVSAAGSRSTCLQSCLRMHASPARLQRRARGGRGITRNEAAVGRRGSDADFSSSEDSSSQ